MVVVFVGVKILGQGFDLGSSYDKVYCCLFNLPFNSKHQVRNYDDILKKKKSCRDLKYGFQPWR